MLSACSISDIKMATTSEVKAMQSSAPSSAAAAAAAAAASVIKNMENAKKISEEMNSTDISAMMEEIKRLRMENDEFKKRQRPVSFSVNDKGGITVNGLGKYPVSLYKIQWERIIAHIEPLKQFIQEHEHELN